MNTVDLQLRNVIRCKLILLVAWTHLQGGFQNPATPPEISFAKLQDEFERFEEGRNVTRRILYLTDSL